MKEFSKITDFADSQTVSIFIAEETFLVYHNNNCKKCTHMRGLLTWAVSLSTNSYYVSKSMYAVFIRLNFKMKANQ